MNLNQVTVGCTDVARSIAFYRRLGLIPIVLTDHYARFVCPDGEASFSIHRVDAVAASETTVFFECADLDADVARLKALGITFQTDPVDEPWLWRQARLRDPDGNRLCLFHAGVNRLDPPWRVRDAHPPSER